MAARTARRRPAARPMTLPPPITGLNTRDALDGMAETDAVTLDNWYPALGSVSIRPGSASWSTGLGGTVETLAEFFAGTTRKLLGAANGKIFDCSSTGAVGAALATGFTSNRWQTANAFGKQFWVNGADTPQTYDGATFAGSGWTGPTATNLIGVYPFKTRIFLIEKNTQKFWYGAVGAITGALTSFDLSPFCERGGNLLAITTMGYSGNAPDDLAVFIMSSGEILLYQGTDPASASTWALVGRYYIGTPVNIRGVARYGGDVYITTLSDHTSLNSWFGAIRGGVPPALSKVSGAVLAATSSNKSGFGWQAVMFPQGGKMIFNVPNLDGSFNQHVLNTVTGAWCRYTGLNASCWGIYNNALYFGGASGVVYQAETGNADSGAVINADGQQAWSQLRSASRKRVSAFRPLIQSVGTIGYSAGVGFDFQPITVGVATSTAPVSAPWNTSPWNTSSWGGGVVVDLNWRVAGGSGQNVGVRVTAAGLQAISWLKTDLLMEPGMNL